MRNMIFALVACAVLAGCAGIRHKPPTCDGRLHPINPARYYQIPAPVAPAVTAPRTPMKETDHG